MGSMREVAAVGLGMHPWGKFKDRSLTQNVPGGGGGRTRRTPASRGGRSRPWRLPARASPAARDGA